MAQREGMLIGAADVIVRARMLIFRCAAIFLDVPEPNREASALALRRGMVPQFEMARMYRGPPRYEPVERIFGITTFELG